MWSIQFLSNLLDSRVIFDFIIFIILIWISLLYSPNFILINFKIAWGFILNFYNNNYFKMIMALAFLVTFFVIYCLITKQIIKNYDFTTSLSASIIGAYAALIVLPLTISVIHYSRIYPQSPLSDVLIKKIKFILLTYFIILLISIINIFIFNPGNMDNFPQYLLVLMLTLQVYFSLFSLIIISKQLVSILKLSPTEIIREIGSEDNIKKHIENGDSDGIKKIIRQNLSLIRSSILDLALREYLEESIDLFSSSLDIIPWYDKNLNRNHSISNELLDHLDESIIDPLKNTHILPDPNAFYPLIKRLYHIFLEQRERVDKQDVYLGKLASIIELYTKNGKPDSFGIFYGSTFCEYMNDKKEATPAMKLVMDGILLSNGLTLFRALINYDLKKDEISWIYITSSFILKFIKNSPQIFSRLSLDDVDAMKDIIKFSNRLYLTEIIMHLAFIKIRKEAISEYEYLIASENWANIIEAIRVTLEIKYWKLYIEKSSVNVALSIVDTNPKNIRTRSSTQLNILSINPNDENEARENLEIIEFFIRLYFSDLILD